MITRIRRKNSPTYCARIYLNGKRHSRTFKRKIEAEAWERKQLTDRAAGRLDPVNRGSSLRDFSIKWMKEKVEARLSASTQAAYKADLENHLLPLFGDLLLNEIRPTHANQLLAHLKAKGRSPKTVNGTLGVLKGILNDAVRWQYLEHNPLQTVSGLKNLPTPEAYWTEGQVEQFLAANQENPLLPVFVFALNTGMRRGEICALKWDRVSFPRNQIEITRSAGRYGIRETTKTGKKRILPMNEVVQDLLHGLRKRLWTEFVFTKADGTSLDAHHLYRDFQAAQKLAGMEVKIRFHDIRHTYASNFMMRGGNIYDLQKMLGHASLDMTQRYAHLSPSHLAKAAEIISFGRKSQQIANDDTQKQQNPPIFREVL